MMLNHPTQRDQNNQLVFHSPFDNNQPNETMNSSSGHSLLLRLSDGYNLYSTSQRTVTRGIELDKENFYDIEIQTQQNEVGVVRPGNAVPLGPATNKGQFLKSNVSMVDKSKIKAVATEAGASVKRQEKEERYRKTHQIELDALNRRKEMARQQILLDQDEIARKEFLKEYAERSAQIHQNQASEFMETNSKPWLSRWKHSLEKINAATANRSKIQRFLKQFHNDIKIEDLYKKHLLRTPDIMVDRATLSLEAERMANQVNGKKSIRKIAAIAFKKEDFHGMAYEALKKSLDQSQTNEKHTWTHLISCDPTARYSTSFFGHKFDLDKQSGRKTSSYGQVDISTKLITSSSQIDHKIRDEVKAITFVIPEKRTPTELHDDSFWKEQRGRFSRIIQALAKERLDFKCPLLIIYHDDGVSDLYKTFYNMPQLLDFKEQKAIIDYHILLIRKETISIRICEEIPWLFKASILCTNI